MSVNKSAPFDTKGEAAKRAQDFSSFLEVRHLLNQTDARLSGCAHAANLIEKIGIYGWDRFGRFCKASEAETGMILDVLAKYHAAWFELRQAALAVERYERMLMEQAKALVAADGDRLSIWQILRTAKKLDKAFDVLRSGNGSYLKAAPHVDLTRPLIGWGWLEDQLPDIEPGVQQLEANQPPEPCLDLESRDSQIVDFIITCKGKRQKDYIKRAAAQFSLANSTIRKIWSEGKPPDYWPTPKRPRP
ncbi:MAG TPA: hypothetical protein PKE37_00215 [Thiomonas arsenitoxydans]|uniref:hypothetical protein n=1 Tax=Thiomonas TaxID=32012 RepID=UPI00257D7FD4|nr:MULTISPECIES: hypothetical protein [Thiomonas]HML80172.1 hypothetical protein [Thiomonas arsenitoxydans]